MTLQQLKYVAAIAECGSLSQAARTLYIAQPSLSKAVTELEKEIGKPLFHRTSRGILLTDDGIEFLAYARQVLQQMEVLEKRFEQGQVTKHFFTVSSQHFNFASEAFAKVVESVSDDMYEFMYIEAQTKDIIEDVKTLRSEIGLIYLSAMNQSVIRRMLREAHLVFEPLVEALPYACLRNNHPLAGRSHLTLEELEEYPFLTYDQSRSNTYSMSEIILEPSHIARHLIVSDRSSAISLMLNTNAYCITAGKYPSASKEWIYIPILEQGKLTIGQIRNQQMVISRLGLRFLEALQDIIQEWKI